MRVQTTGAGSLRLAFDSVNKQGGVNGNTFTLVRADDHNDPASTVEQTRKLVAEQRPLVLAGYFGGRNLAALLASGILDQQRLALVGYRTTGIPPSHPLLFNVRADVRDELAKLTEHLATLGITRLGLLHEAGADAVVAAADEAAGRAKTAFVIRASYAPDSRSAGPLVAALQCERVHMAGDKGVCLTPHRGVFTTYRAVLFDGDFKRWAELPLAGVELAQGEEPEILNYHALAAQVLERSGILAGRYSGEQIVTPCLTTV